MERQSLMTRGSLECTHQWRRLLFPKGNLFCRKMCLQMLEPVSLTRRKIVGGQLLWSYRAPTLFCILFELFVFKRVNFQKLLLEIRFLCNHTRYHLIKGTLRLEQGFL